MSTNVKIRNLVKRYGDYTAVKGINLDIDEGEFVTLLGGSGCGKTTILRMLAGFIEVDEGEIYFGDKLMNNILPEKRDISMMFQSYALFPHKTVENNINFGLKMHNVDKDIQKKKVEDGLKMVHMEGLENRKPHELSGGQQQRVALARAMAVTPKLLLFDEPLSNLDAKLRVQVRMEIRDIQRQYGITTIYVTHDQEEAMSISDKVVVMNQGEIMQIGSPREIYKNPNNAFVANFIGTSNILNIKEVKNNGDINSAATEIGNLIFKTNDMKDCTQVSFRPEDVIINEINDIRENVYYGIVKKVVYLGKFQQITVETNGIEICIEVDKNTIIQENEKIKFHIPVNKIHVLRG